MPDSISDRPLSKSVCDLLLERGKLSVPGLERATRLQAESGEKLETIFTRLGLVPERDLADALATLLDLPLAPPDCFPQTAIFSDRLSSQFLRQVRVVPIEETPEGVSLAMADPLDEFAVNSIAFAIKKAVLRRVATPTDIDTAIERLYGGESAAGTPSSEAADGITYDATDDFERLKDLASEAPVIRLVNALIARAVEAGASDIHLEPHEDHLRIRLRIDGLLQEIEPPPTRLRAAIISRIKIMAKLNIAERRLPQDGRIRLAVRGKEIDFRISTTPAIHGESVVMRILDRSALALDFHALGFDDAILKAYLETLDRPHGILLVTGPTGSGKTTTLYTSLTRLNTVDKKILTIEDPIEYQLPGVNQVQVKPQIGLTFASALRSFLRQDPDIMMVGEIRDLETAQVAVQAALTGHLILSTLHTNDAASAITRLLDMGVEDYLLTSTINGLVAQRLVRTLCEECRTPYRPSAEYLEKIQFASFDRQPSDRVFCQPRGCDNCRGSGYRGRTTILEVMPLSNALRNLVLGHSEAREIQKMAVSEGMETMYQCGLRKVAAGATTVEEVVRVTRDF